VNDRGSALLLAVFVLAILTGMGIALHFQAHSELIMCAADRQTQQTYFLAEAGIEAARQQLFNTNGNGSFDDDLVTQAGADGIIDFDPDALRAVYAADGTVSGFTGYGDDQPLVNISLLGTGWYAAFLTNDPANTGGTGSTNDDNDRVMITAVGAGRRGALEIVQAIVEPAAVFPADLPATITIFGANPTFDDVDDTAKVFQGDDCGGAGIPGFSVPVVGLIGTPAESVVEGSLSVNTVYTSAADTGHVTVTDLTDPTDPGMVPSSLGTIDPSWIDCGGLRSMAGEVRSVADVICFEGLPCTLPPSSPNRIVFAEGDFTLGSGDSGAGLLWVTGRLTVNGATNWHGILMVIGEGEFFRSGVGTGKISGATMVADIVGPDNVYGNADDCTGGSAGFAPAVFDESVGGTGPTEYCNVDVLAATPITKYTVAEFRQR
jgi:hypothetical protein